MNDISTFEHWIRLSLSLVSYMHVLQYPKTKSRFYSVIQQYFLTLLSKY